MKQTRALVASLMLIFTTGAAYAMTLEAGIEEVVVLEEPAVIEKKTRPNREGHIGVRINCCGDVNYVHPDSPADRAGIIKGDHVKLVDGRKHNVTNISGPPGTFVELEIKRRRIKERFTLAVERVDVNLIRP